MRKSITINTGATSENSTIDCALLRWRRPRRRLERTAANVRLNKYREGCRTDRRKAVRACDRAVTTPLPEVGDLAFYLIPALPVTVIGSRSACRASVTASAPSTMGDDTRLPAGGGASPART